MKLVLLHLLLSVLAARSIAAEPEKERFLSTKQRIVFLGDSNTYAAHYVNLIETALLRQAPELELEILNLGLNGETCSGSSEPDHPYPRPTVHERLGRILARTQPDVVVAAYGMNDGIYHPQSPNRFSAFKNGIRELVRKVDAAGARLVLLTPPPFDPTALRGTKKLAPKSANRFAWFSIYEDYDEVLKDYTDWLLTDLKDERIDVLINIRKPLREHTAKRQRADRDYLLMEDGVHFNFEGHQIVAKTLLLNWGFAAEVESNSMLYNLVSERQRLLRDAWLTHCGHKRPDVKPGLPLKEAQDKAHKLRQQIIRAEKHR